MNSTPSIQETVNKSTSVFAIILYNMYHTITRHNTTQIVLLYEELFLQRTSPLSVFIFNSYIGYFGYVGFENNYLIQFRGLQTFKVVKYRNTHKVRFILCIVLEK